MKRCYCLIIIVMVLSCTKEVDDTEGGPKAKITIINAALDSDPVNLILDGVALNTEPIPFGGSSGTSANSYLETAPGVRSTFWQVGGTAGGEEKFLSWAGDAHYTLVQYDTAIANLAPLLLVADNISLSDTLAKIRFINCIAGTDSLSLWLIGAKDTIRVATKSVFIGQSGGFPAGFASSCPPGSRRLELLSNAGVILYQEEISFTEKSSYSLVGFGETGGTGAKAPFVRQLAQLK